MKYFEKVAEGMDTFPVLHGLRVKPELWDEFPVRTEHPGTVHGDVSDVLLRYQWLGEPGAYRSEHEIQQDLECGPYDAWMLLPQAAGMVMALMARVGGTRLGRVVISKLPPGKAIAPHIDGGANASYYQRYQIALLNAPGSLFRIGDETVQFATGDIWWIDNLVEHEVVNNSAHDRLAMIVDIRVE